MICLVILEPRRDKRRQDAVCMYCNTKSEKGLVWRCDGVHWQVGHPIGHLSFSYGGTVVVTVYSFRTLINLSWNLFFISHLLFHYGILFLFPLHSIILLSSSCSIIYAPSDRLTLFHFSFFCQNPRSFQNQGTNPTTAREFAWICVLQSLLCEVSSRQPRPLVKLILHPPIFLKPILFISPVIITYKSGNLGHSLLCPIAFSHALMKSYLIITCDVS